MKALGISLTVVLLGFGLLALVTLLAMVNHYLNLGTKHLLTRK
jgi:hypothetical protein